MKNKYVHRLICLAGIVSTFFSCQRSGVEAPPPDQPLSGTIRISAPLALHRVNQAWAREFSKTHPQVSFELIEASAPQRLADLEEGRADLGMVCRSL
jgi:DNA-binding transcriptional LysR family regulator